MTDQHTVRIMRVNGIRSRQPGVVAFVDGIRVKWNSKGWMCDCDTFHEGTGDDLCPHIDAIEALLDYRVTKEQQ